MHRLPGFPKVTDPNKQCPTCKGHGEIDVGKKNSSYGPSTVEFVKCEPCDGSGKKAKEEAMDDSELKS